MARDLGDVLHYFLDDPPADAAPAGTPAGRAGPTPAQPARQPDTPPRDRVALASLVARLDPPLRLVATRVLGAGDRMDVARGPGGRATVVLQAAHADEARGALTTGLGHAAWLAPRVADWCQLAPALDLDAAAGVGVVVIAPAFDGPTRAAARSLGPRARLVRVAHPRPTEPAPQD